MSRYDAIPDALVTADLGEGAGVQPVVDWSVTRQMSGGGLPGQARGASGMSVGSGSVTVDSPAGRSPWTPGPIRPGGRVALDARADTSAPMSPVARMVVRDVSGTATSRTLSVGVEDDIERLRKPALMPATIAPDGAPIDAAAVVDALARSAGYLSTTPHSTTHRMHLSVPLVGSTEPLIGTTGERTAVEWVSRGSQIGAKGPATLAYVPLLFVHRVLHLTVQHDGAGHIRANLPGLGINDTVRVYQDRVELWGAETKVATAALVGAPPAGSWRRVEVRIDARDTTWTLRARVEGGTPSTTTVSPGATFTDALVYRRLYLVDGAAAYELRCTSAPDLTEDDALAVSQTAHIDASGARLAAVLIDGQRSAWEVLQEIARCTLGWVGIDADGSLVYRGRDALRGGTPVERIVAEESLEDVPWTISMDDVADRVEVTYAPPSVRRSTVGGLDVWESTETIPISPGGKHVIEADIEGAADKLAYWIPAWWDHVPEGQLSRWNAFLSADLTGPQPADNALAISARMLSPSRVRISVANRSGAALWVSLLTLRANVRATRGETLTLARGAADDDARSALTYDLGAWVQDEDAAREILDWLGGTASEPLPILTGVRVIPDASRHLGQVVTVADRTTALATKALITGVSMTGSDGSLAQNLDLAILATTFDDVDTWLKREGLTTFDALDARLTALGLTTFDKLDDFLTRLGGTL